VADRLAAMRGSQVHVLAARGEPLEFARDYMQHHGLQHLIDARAARGEAVREEVQDSPQAEQAKRWILRGA
jgi:hypothetical protein